MSKKEESIYPGELLKEARKKTRRRYKSLSSELGIPEKYLEALEENNFSIMAGPTYVKGYLRAYAKKLDLDPETIITAFDRYLKDQRRLKKKAIKEEQKKETKQKFFYIYALIFLLIALITLLIVFIPEGNTNSEKKEDISSYSETEIQNSNDISLILNTKPALIIELEQDTSQNISDLNIQKEVITSNLTDDAKVSLASTTNVKTNVSCLVLPEGRCSEFTLSN